MADGPDRADGPVRRCCRSSGRSTTPAGTWRRRCPFWIGPILLYILLPALDLRFGPDGQNPPDEVMERLENDKYYRYCTYAYIPFQYASVIFGAYLFTASDLSWLGFDGGLNWVTKIGLALSVGRARRRRHQHRPRTRPQEGLAGALAVQDHPGADLLRPLLHRAQPRPPRPRRHPGGSGVGPVRGDVLGVPAAQRLRQPALVLGAGGPASAPGRQESLALVQRRAQRLGDVGGVLRHPDRGLRRGADSVHRHLGGVRLHPAGDGQLPRALRAAAAEDGRAAATSAARPSTAGTPTTSSPTCSCITCSGTAITTPTRRGATRRCAAWTGRPTCRAGTRR